MIVSLFSVFVFLFQTFLNLFHIVLLILSSCFLFIISFSRSFSSFSLSLYPLYRLITFLNFLLFSCWFFFFFAFLSFFCLLSSILKIVLIKYCVLRFPTSHTFFSELYENKLILKYYTILKIASYYYHCSELLGIASFASDSKVWESHLFLSRLNFSTHRGLVSQRVPGRVSFPP